MVESILCLINKIKIMMENYRKWNSNILWIKHNLDKSIKNEHGIVESGNRWACQWGIVFDIKQIEIF